MTNQAMLGGLLILVLLLSSCIKYEGTIKIEDDGSGTVRVLSAVDPEAFETLAGFGDLGEEFGDSSQICDEFNNDVNAESDVPPGGSIEPYNEDGFCGATITYPLAASNDHSNDLAEFLDSSTRLYKEGDNWFFDTNFNANEITGEADDFGDDIVADLFGDASFRITIDLPGRAVGGANNATQVGDDGVFRWDIDLLNPPARLFAQTEPGSGGGDGSSISLDGSSDGGGGGISPILIGVIVALLLAAVGFFFWNKKKNEAGAVTDTLVQPGADPNPLVPNPVTPGGSTMPVTDGPAITATPPAAGSFKETVVLSAAGVADAVEEADSPASPPQPVYDEDLQAWVVDDPARGRLRHDPATDTWNPIQP